MNDTLKHIEDIYYDKFSLLAGETRLRMAAESFDTARILALASAGSDLDEMSKKVFLLKRFYGDEKLCGEWEKELRLKRKDT